MMRVLTGVLAAVVATGAMAQWSADPSANLVLADRANDQVQPKVRPGPNGTFYVSWFDNATGGYKPTLQRLNARGYELWPHNGVTIANTTNSSTQDYDLKVDADGDALITFQDNSSGTALISVHKISPAGVRLWGASGVAVPGSTGGNQPKVAACSNGDVVVGVSVGAGFTLTRLNGAGQPYANGVVNVSESGRTVTLSDLQAGDNGSVIALWIRPFTTSFLSSKWLYAQKFSSTGSMVWTPSTVPTSTTPVTLAAVAIYAPQPNTSGYGNQGGSIQNGYFPNMIPDGTGGVVCAWYENANLRDAYVQHVLADGTLRFQLNGQPTGSSRIASGGAAGLNQSGSGWAAFDPTNQNILLAWSETNRSTQTTYGIYAQEFSGSASTGVTSRYAAGGLEIRPGETQQPSFVVCNISPLGRSVTWLENQLQPAQVRSAIFEGGGPPGVVGSVIVSSGGAKSRLDTAIGADGSLVSVFGNGASGDTNINIQPVRFPGALGSTACTIADLATVGGRPAADGSITVDDLIVFLSNFFAMNTDVADLAIVGGAPGVDGQLTADDLILCLSRFFQGCPN